MKKQLKQILFLALLFLTLHVYAQKKELKVTGKVYDCDSKKPIERATIKLFCQNGDTASTKSDAAGNYFFDSKILKPNFSYVLLIIAPAVKQILYGKCPFSYNRNNQYMDISEKQIFKTDTIKTIKEYDFCLTLYAPEIRIPEIYFKKNSLEYETQNLNYVNYDMRGDTALDCLIDLMMNYSEYTAEISGYADSLETNSKNLSEQRAKKVYDLMILKGIEQERITYKGYSSEIYNKEFLLMEATPDKVRNLNNKKVRLLITAKNHKTKNGVKLINKLK